MDPYCFLSSNIVTDNVANLSLMLRALIEMANHIMFSPLVTFCLPLLTPPYPIFPTLLLPYSISPPIVHLPVSGLIDLSFSIISLSHFKYFSRPHFIYIPASSPCLLIHRSLHISLFLSPPVSPPWQPWPS